MIKTAFIALWRSRIQGRILSGLKMNAWYEQNSISRGNLLP